MTFLLCLFASGAATAEDRPLVVASIKPLALMAGDLAGDWLAVETLLATNQEPHHVSLSVSQRRKLAQADLVLWVGPELESFLAKLIGQLPAERRLGFGETAAGAGVRLNPHDAHYWLNPALAAVFYRALAAKLQQRFPDKAAGIEQRLARSLAEVDRVSDRLRQRLAPHRSRQLIVDHQAYGYFADYFQLAIVGSLVDESGVAAGARSVVALAERVDTACIAVEQYPPGRAAAKMAETLDVGIVAIDPLGGDLDDQIGYPALLEAVGLGFERCFASGHQRG